MCQYGKTDKGFGLCADQYVQSMNSTHYSCCHFAISESHPLGVRYYISLPIYNSIFNLWTNSNVFRLTMDPDNLSITAPDNSYFSSVSYRFESKIDMQVTLFPTSFKKTKLKSELLFQNWTMECALYRRCEMQRRNVIFNNF